MSERRLFCWWMLLAIGLISSRLVPAADPFTAGTPSDAKKVSYYRDIRPLFQERCQGCHQPAKASGGLVMISVADMLKPGEGGAHGIIPRKPEASEILKQILSTPEQKALMPKDRPALSTTQVELVRRWIAEGAADDTPPMEREVIDMQHPPTYAAPPVITSLAYAPDGSVLAVSGYHEVLLHKPDGSGIVARLVGLSERIQSLAFSPDGKLLAVTGGSPARFGEVQIWNVAERKLALAVTLTYDTIYGVSWSPDGTKVAFGCGDNSVRAIDAATGQQVLFQGAHSDWVLDTVFSTDASHLISVGRDRSMKLTEVATQRFVDNITSITPGALKGGLQTVARHPSKDQLLIGGADGIPKLYKTYREQARVIGDDFNKIREYEAQPGRINAVEFNADGSLLVVGSSSDGTGDARVYQTEDAKLVARLGVEPVAEGQPAPASVLPPIYAVGFSPDSKQVAAGGFDGRVRLFDTATGKMVADFPAAPLVPATAQR